MVEKVDQAVDRCRRIKRGVRTLPRAEGSGQSDYPTVETPARQKNSTIFLVEISVVVESESIIPQFPGLLFDGDALGQITGLVDIATASVGDLVGQKL